jgi:hypothetical protein
MGFDFRPDPGPAVPGLQMQYLGTKALVTNNAKKIAGRCLCLMTGIANGWPEPPGVANG